MFVVSECSLLFIDLFWRCLNWVTSFDMVHFVRIRLFLVVFFDEAAARGSRFLGLFFETVARRDLVHWDRLLRSGLSFVLSELLVQVSLDHDRDVDDGSKGKDSADNQEDKGGCASLEFS